MSKYELYDLQELIERMVSTRVVSTRESMTRYLNLISSFFSNFMPYRHIYLKIACEIATAIISDLSRSESKEEMLRKIENLPDWAKETRRVLRAIVVMAPSPPKDLPPDEEIVSILYDFGIFYDRHGNEVEADNPQNANWRTTTIRFREGVFFPTEFITNFLSWRAKRTKTVLTYGKFGNLIKALMPDDVIFPAYASLDSPNAMRLTGLFISDSGIDSLRYLARGGEK